ncbi:MAG: YraN family protein [Microthrixaceae bacterium]
MDARRYDPHRLGAYGEERVARWYTRHGYVVLDRNWRCRHGELDLVLRGHGTLVICEVKTRTSDRFGTPFEAVDVRKQRRIRRLAVLWLEEHDEHRGAVRFDVAGVRGARVEVLEAAW